jgi:sterol desaturase/sphingolipid hydroxylase (fatty acid hydroxylase superfamily)
MDAALVTIRYFLLVIVVWTTIFSIVEGIGLKLAKRPYDWRAMLASVMCNIGFIASTALPIAIALPGAFWLYEHRLFAAPEVLGAWSFVLLFLGIDFLYYWQHRMGHRSRYFWLTHSVHHTALELNFSASYRVGWTGRLLGVNFVFLPLCLLGYEPELILAFFGMMVGYQFWIHSDWIPKLGFIEGIVNTPSAHRVHHACNIEYLDANYGGVLMIFDRMFGTYRPELDEVPVRYGLALSSTSTYNPLKIVFGQFLPAFRDLLKARSAHQAVMILFGPPGWQPDGNGPTTDNLQRWSKLEVNQGRKAEDFERVAPAQMEGQMEGMRA